MTERQQKMSHDRQRPALRRVAILSGASSTCYLWLAATLAGCAAEQPLAEYPRNETICQYVGLESVVTPEHTNIDSVSFLAVYRFREPNVPPPKHPLTVKFQVDRSRIHDLRAHLESQREVVCSPDHEQHYRVHVKPLPP